MADRSFEINFCKKHENQLIALLVLAGLMVFCTLRYDFYYNLNDDVLIKDILSGAYTGTPESINIQLMYPLSLVISLFYRVFKNAPVYGIFLVGCQFACIVLIICRTLRFFKHTGSKIAAAAVMALGIAAVFRSHLIFIQYTATSALLAAAAIFLFMTFEETNNKSDKSVKHFFIGNLPSIVLAVLSFCLRSEMLLLVFPFIGVAGIFRWSEEKSCFTKDNIKKYMSVFGTVCAAILIVFAVNEWKYMGEEWKEFTAFFDSRTELYDFQEIPSYEGNESIYEDLGFTQNEQYMLFSQYNFGLEDHLDAKTLDAISAYQKERKEEDFSLKEKLKQSVWLYVNRMLDRKEDGNEVSADYPLNYMLMIAYLAVFAVSAGAFGTKGYSIRRSMVTAGGQLLFLAFVRTALWMFIIIRGRAPERITESLYLVELILLSALFIIRLEPFLLKIKSTQTSVYCRSLAVTVCLTSALFACLTAVGVRTWIQSADKDYSGRELVNAVNIGMKEYCRSHRENFYMIDVYSSVSHKAPGTDDTYLYSEKIFGATDNSLTNYDILGGWACKSPQSKKKLEAFQISSMSDALISREDVYLLSELEKGSDPMTGFYKDRGTPVTMELVDTIQGIVGVWKVQKWEQ